MACDVASQPAFVGGSLVWWKPFSAMALQIKGGTRYAEYSWGKVLNSGQFNLGQS
jgi:hypothetical protein